MHKLGITAGTIYCDVLLKESDARKLQDYFMSVIIYDDHWASNDENADYFAEYDVKVPWPITNHSFTLKVLYPDQTFKRVKSQNICVRPDAEIDALLAGKTRLKPHEPLVASANVKPLLPRMAPQLQQFGKWAGYHGTERPEDEPVFSRLWCNEMARDSDRIEAMTPRQLELAVYDVSSQQYVPTVGVTLIGLEPVAAKTVKGTTSIVPYRELYSFRRSIDPGYMCGLSDEDIAAIREYERYRDLRLPSSIRSTLLPQRTELPGQKLPLTATYETKEPKERKYTPRNLVISNIPNIYGDGVRLVPMDRYDSRTRDAAFYPPRRPFTVHDDKEFLF